MNQIDTSQRKRIRSYLTDISKTRYKDYGNSFQNAEQFHTALESCYSLIAFRTCREWCNRFNATLNFSASDFTHNRWYYADLLPFTPIHSDLFDNLFSSFRCDGRKRKVPYSFALNALEDEGIIEVNKSYSTGCFSKSYRLRCDFMLSVITDYLQRKNMTDDNPNIYDCFCAYCPSRILKQRLKEAETLYHDLQPHEGLSVRLPRGWRKQLSAFGFLTFDTDGLDIFNLIDGLRFFDKHQDYGFTAGRHYDWFVSCSSAFRKYIYLDGKPYHELIDCHSGFFWMFAIYGYQQGRISIDECERMIEHCLGGHFYADIAEQPKSVEVKLTFQKVLNTTVRQMKFIEENCHDKLFIRIRKNLAIAYPLWSSFLEDLRAKPSLRRRKKIGQFNHYALTKIERKIMESLQAKLEDMGLRGVRRVHDALWGVDDIKEGAVNAILKKTIADYLKSTTK